jgi:glycosyltransferase involved in cell wall biosynthesis
LLASSLLREQVNQERQFVCHGVSYHRADVRDFDRQLGVPVRFLFGGSLLRETGVQLLIDCVLKLEKEHQGIQSKVKFVVTGFGPMAEDLQVLSSSCGKNWIEYHGSVDIMTYRDILSSVQVAMCLKLPSTEMCSTTFPSKVVEYASFGKAVLTTRIEDVVRLFGEDGAYILQDEKVETLVKTIIDIALNPEDISDIAKEGQARLIERSGKDAVADGVMGLLANFVD